MIAGLINLKRTSAASWLTGVYLFTWYTQLSGRNSFLEAIRFEFLFGVLLILVSIKNLAGAKRVSGLLLGPAISLILLAFLYSVFSYDASYSFNIFINRVIKLSVVALFIYANVKNEDDLKLVVGFVMLAWCRIAFEASYGWLTGSLVWQNQGIMRLHGSTGMYQHPNSLSGFAVGCFPFVFAFLMAYKNMLVRAFFAIMLCFVAICILFSGSRTGYVATIGVMFYFLFWYKVRFAKALFLLPFVVMLAVIYVPDQYKERFESIVTLEEKEGDSSGKRLEIIQDAIQVYSEYPFGVGVGAFPLVRAEMFGRKQDTHNLYLELLTNMGPFGLMLFIWFVFRMFRVARQCLERCNNLEDPTFFKALLGGLLGFLLARLFLGLFGMDFYEIYWWFLAGMLATIYKLVEGSSIKRS